MKTFRITRAILAAIPIVLLTDAISVSLPNIDKIRCLQ